MAGGGCSIEETKGISQKLIDLGCSFEKYCARSSNVVFGWQNVQSGGSFEKLCGSFEHLYRMLILTVFVRECH